MRASTCIAFDFGKKRIGTAVGDENIGIAHPLSCIETSNDDVRFQHIHRLVAEWNPVRFVVGYPTQDEKPHPFIPFIKAFAQRLEREFTKDVILINENYSSHEASQNLSEIGVRGREQKAYLDSVSAQIILQSYFDQRKL